MTTPSEPQRAARRGWEVALGAVCLLAMTGAAAPQRPAFLVRDINEQLTDVPSDPRSFVPVGGTTFFSASTLETGRELWKTDGTTDGTVLVKDIWPDHQDSEPYELIAVGDTLFFTADDGVSGRELWASDGTEGGTRLVRDILPGGGWSYPTALAEVGGTLFFTAYDDVNGPQLWKSDGTADGTSRVSDFTGRRLEHVDIVGVNGTAYMLALSDFASPEPMAAPLLEDAGLGLWISDGTTGGTVLVKRWPQQPWYGRLLRAGDAVTFQVCEGDEQYLEECPRWRSDGTGAGTFPVPVLDGFRELMAVRDTLFLASGTELWRSDGTAPGTALVRSFDGTVGNLWAVGKALFFTVQDNSSPAFQLWRSDGTPQGTVLLRSFPRTLSSFAPAEDGLFFFEYYDPGASVLWRSDGTTEGTVSVATVHDTVLRPGTDGARLFFVAGGELWTSDGTEEGTGLLKNIAPEGTQDSSPSALTELNGTLLFRAEDGLRGPALWRSNGGGNTTELVAQPGSWSQPQVLPWVELNEAVFFRTDGGLWKSDGTPAGTLLVTDFPQDCVLSALARAGQALVLAYGQSSCSECGPCGVPLWTSDGTAAGTVPIDSSVQFSWLPLAFAPLGGTLLFPGAIEQGNLQLWRTDGTTPGTVLVSDLVEPMPLSAILGRGWAAEAGGMLFFAGREILTGNDDQLWVTDGTAGGTKLVRGFSAGSPQLITAAGGRLFFTADDGVSGRELWTSDGTEGGTSLVRDIRPGVDSSSPLALTAAGGLLFFSADDGVSGRELWVSNGTEDGTAMLKDIAPGPASSNPLSAPDGHSAGADIGSRLVFRACDPDAGCEVWRSDGSEEGTWRVADVAPGTRSSEPEDFVLSGEAVYFSAYEPVHGRELWAIPLEALELPPTCVGDCDDDGMVAVSELILGVDIALGEQPLGACPAFRNADGMVDIAQLITGVNNALEGCPSGEPG